MGFKLNLKGTLFEKDSDKRNEVIAVILLALAVFLFISFFTFDYNDVVFFTSNANTPTHNAVGSVGAYIGSIFLMIMGMSAYVIPILVLFWAITRFAGLKPESLYFKFFGTLFLILAASSTLSLLSAPDMNERFRMGGIIGVTFSDYLVRYFGRTGAWIIISLLLILSVLIATDFLIFPFIISVIKFVISKFEGLVSKLMTKRSVIIRSKSTVKEKKKKIFADLPSFGKPKPDSGRQSDQKPKIKSEPAIPQMKISSKETAKIEKTSASPEPVMPVERMEEVKLYTPPSLELLNSPPPVEDREIKDDLTENSHILEEVLSDFDIEAKVIEVNRGPVITRYELEPGAGVKVHRITSLSDNIALAMKAQSVRIVAPVPGKGTIGVEVPNTKGVFVYLKEIIETEDYNDEESILKLALGKDIAGDPVIVDLGTMPHLLIAGATGSGKTVCVNSIITSVLFNASPEEVRFIMVDPKKVELAPFNDLPHLLCPVVTDYKKVPLALEWLVREMEKRYELFARCGVRNIDFYNRKANEENWQRLYYIVVIIDELADLMLVAQQEIESAITRLAQLSRAVGIHMILATQRPSVNVITGVIKANFPARISFKVASKVDSRTVLDRNGAEKLLGRGDMLVVQPSSDKPVRAQGGLVSDDEIDRVTGFIKKQRKAEYEADLIKAPKKDKGSKFHRDEIYDEAVRILFETRQASVSMLQRKLGVGYTKAARLIDMMEDDGIVGPYQGSKPREILVESIDEIYSSE